MLSTIIVKELKNIIVSPKFSATFAVTSLLLLLSVYVGINEYQATTRQYEAATGLVDQRLRETRSWARLSNRVYRVPNPMHVFVAGVNNDIGRTSIIDPTEQVKLTNSTYNDEPIYAAFRFIDFTFIVTIIFSLFAILFTYDAVNGERENGTLQLTFANALPRVHFIAGKFVGLWLGLIVPLLIPIVLSVVLVLAYKIPLAVDHWMSVAAIVLVSLLFCTFFIAFGICISAVTRRSSTSFLFLLVAWIVISFILPRAGVMAAGTLHPVASVAEVEGMREAFAKQIWAKHRDEMQERFRKRADEMQNMTAEERSAYEDEHAWEMMEQEDKARKDILKQIDLLGKKLEEETRNGRRQQEGLALVLSRFSPASAYQLAAMTLAGMNIDVKSAYEDALSAYRASFVTYKEKKEKESGDSGGIRITVDSNTGFKFSMGRESGSLDISEMPRFNASRFSFSGVLASALPDIVLLCAFTFLAFAAAFVAFLRYDVR
ncbi:MAG: ABC transporter permease subunit [Ignavibacteriae bacterium]|nr:ABC transporter permease subunit [Ignavibacteriota bacterium]